MAPALDVTGIAWSEQWNNRQMIDRWKARMTTDMRRYRNHPSVLMWATSPNYFGNGDDQNPRRIGRKKVEGTIEARRRPAFAGKNPFGK